MSGEPRVDVSYRGLPLATGVAIGDIGPTTAFVAAPQPMPVGTAVEITAEGAGAFMARVVHVEEQTEDVATAGMRISVSDLSGGAQAWWDGLVTREDPTPLEDAEPVAAAPEPAAAPDVEAVPEPVAANQTPQRTQVMSAVDLSQIEALANEAKDDDFEARAAEAAAAGVEAETDADAAEPRGKKKRKKRSRKKKS